MREWAASSRMYNVAPGATAAWGRVLAAVSRAAGVRLDIVEHAHPATLASLWDRTDLGCAFMCGWPLAQAPGGRRVLAAPVPAGASGPRYRSVFVVAAGSPFRTLADTFGERFAVNARGSHSGWNMPMAHVQAMGGAFRAEIGPFGPHQASARAVAAGEAEVAALDSLVWALLCRHDAALAGVLRVVDQTAEQPAPPLVAGAGLPERVAAALTAALLALDPAELEDVCLARFAPAALADYGETLRIGLAA